MSDNNGELIALRSRIDEAEDQCRHERAARIQLAVLVAGFLTRAVPLVRDAGISLDVPTEQG